MPKEKRAGEKIFQISDGEGGGVLRVRGKGASWKKKAEERNEKK